MHCVMETRLERNHVGEAALEHLTSEALLMEGCFLTLDVVVEPRPSPCP